MTKEQITAWARAAGFAHCEHYSGGWMATIMRLAQMVAAAKRDACVMACDKISADQWALFKGRAPYTGREEGRASEYVQGKSDGADDCANAIREMGQS